MLKRLTIVLLAISASMFAAAQVTTSSMNGTVKDNSGTPLAGATVTAVHTPSGSKYTTISSREGIFNLQGLRIGGPYQVRIEYVGLKPATFDSITLQLGEAYNINVQLSVSEQILENVVVSAKNRKTSGDKFGASTIIGNRLVSTLPTINRSLGDFTRLTPQANGNSFAGRDGRFNNVTVDGANLNNNFGLSTDPLPGGGSNPISLDAIDEVSVNIAPYDVRQAQFTGANIAAVTKSGTNTFHGTAYGYWRNQHFIGTDVAGLKLPPLQKTYNKIFGASLGGPIIKNKLFFFVNGEYEEKSAVLTYYTPAGGSGSGNMSSVPIDSLKILSDYLKSTYHYDPGLYDNFNTTVPIKNHKVLAKIDWNISTVSKLTVKFSDFQNVQDFLPSQSGGINGANATGLITYGPKFSPTAMAFGNTIYSQTDKVRTGSLDLTSNFRGKFSNEFLATITKIGTTKQHPGDQFPFVDIAGATPGSKQNYISFGNEPFNGNYNVVINNVYTVTDNFSYYAGKNTFTAGASYEFQKVGNGFMAGSQGYYAYASLDDFLNNRAPKQFAITYPLIPGVESVISANLKVGQLGAYLQDEINVNQNFKLTAGLRVDRPVYPEQPLPNAAVDALQLHDAEGNFTTYSTGQWPKATLYWSPRVGFRANIPDEKLVIRGGTGLYTGRIPFVYLTNLPTGVGPYQFGVLVTPTTNGANINDFLFNPDAHAYNPFYNKALNPAVFPTIGGTVVPSGAYALIADHFKFPQVWRTDIAFDKQIGKGWSATLEGLYTKDIHAVYMFNSNQEQPDGSVDLGGGNIRPAFTASAARKLNATSGNAIVLDNTNQGKSFSLTAQINKSFSKGWYGFVAYTYTAAFDISANPGSQANSVWSANPTSLTQNDIELSTSAFSVPHRIVGALSYRFEYAKHLATTISAYYEGAAQGNISYTYNGDVNNDGNSADLMYIPKDPSEINFVPIAASGNVPGFTAQQQSDAFFKFIAQDKYLSKHQGQVAERNGAIQPWYSRVDLKFAEDIFTNVGGRRNTVQFTVDVVNALNLINSDWGVHQFFIVSNPLKYVNATSGLANYQLQTYLPQGASQQILLDRTYIHNNSTTSTWNLQLGLRYIF